MGERDAEESVELGRWTKRRDGRPCECSLLTHTAVRPCTFVPDEQQLGGGQWRVEMTRLRGGDPDAQQQEQEFFEQFDHIWLATGCAPPSLQSGDAVGTDSNSASQPQTGRGRASHPFDYSPRLYSRPTPSSTSTTPPSPSSTHTWNGNKPHPQTPALPTKQN